MFSRILSRLGLAPKPKKRVSTIKLDVIAEQVKEFKQAKTEMDEKIHTLEDRTEKLDETISKTLDMTCENQKRLDSIEGNIKKMLDISQKVIEKRNGGAPTQDTAFEPTASSSAAQDGAANSDGKSEEPSDEQDLSSLLNLPEPDQKEVKGLKT